MSQDTSGIGRRHDQVLTSIGRRIVAGEQPPGSVLTLDGICTQYEVSRTVAREVIRVLESMGLVSSRRRVGITIQPQTKWSVFDPRLIRWRRLARQANSHPNSTRDLTRETGRGLRC